MEETYNDGCWIPKKDKPRGIATVLIFIIFAASSGFLFGCLMQPTIIQYIDNSNYHSLYQSQNVTIGENTTYYVNQTTVSYNNGTYYNFEWIDQNFTWGVGDHIYIFSSNFNFYGSQYNFTNYTYSAVVVAHSCFNNQWNNYNITINGTLLTYNNQAILIRGNITNSGDIDILINDQFAPSGYWVVLDFYFFLTELI